MAGVEAAEERAGGLTPLLRRVLVLNSALAMIAGSDLFFASEVTGRYFAWTIEPPLTAAFLGGAYLSSVVLLFVSAREPEWPDARIGAVSAQVFITLLLAAMLLHIERFHTGTTEPITFFATWSFIGTYVVVPPLTFAALVRQIRRRSVDGPGSGTLPRPFRAALGVQGGAMVLLGGALVLVPARADALWPWSLTPLTARAVGAFLTAIGVGVVLGVLDGHWSRLRAAFAAYAVLALLEGVALARYSSTVDWSRVETWVYVVFIGSILVAGAYGWARARGFRSVPARVGELDPA